MYADQYWKFPYLLLVAVDEAVRRGYIFLSLLEFSSTTFSVFYF